MTPVEHRRWEDGRWVYPNDIPDDQPYYAVNGWVARTGVGEFQTKIPENAARVADELNGLLAEVVRLRSGRDEARLALTAMNATSKIAAVAERDRLRGVVSKVEAAMQEIIRQVQRGRPYEAEHIARAVLVAAAVPPSADDERPARPELFDVCDDQFEGFFAALYYCTRHLGHRGPHSDASGVQWRRADPVTPTDPPPEMSVDQQLALDVLFYGSAYFDKGSGRRIDPLDMVIRSSVPAETETSDPPKLATGGILPPTALVFDPDGRELLIRRDGSVRCEHITPFRTENMSQETDQ